MYGPQGWPGGEQTACGTKHFSSLVYKPPPLDEQVLEIFDYCPFAKGNVKGTFLSHRHFVTSRSLNGVPHP